jgi:hypothetical protein
MIHLIEDIVHNDSLKIPLNSGYKKIFVEVASNRKIDIGILNESQLKKFYAGEDADVGTDWFENTRTLDRVFDFDEKAKRYLLFWSSNEEGNALVAYKMTPLEPIAE